MELFLMIGFIAIWVGVAFYVTTYYLLIVRIKNKHPELWKTLGSPDIFVRNNRQHSKPVWEFIERQKPALPKDQFLLFCITILSKGKLYRAISLWYFIFFVLFYIVKKKIL